MSDIFGGDFGWANDGVPLPVATVSPVAATISATAKSTQKCGLDACDPAHVAHIATVAAWREGVERLARGCPPARYEGLAWRVLVSDAQMLLQTWGKDFAELGWTTLDVFGVNRNPGARRLDIPGLLIFLHGNMVEAIDGNGALIRVNAKDAHTFRRDSVAAGGVPVWDWVGDVQ